MVCAAGYTSYGGKRDFSQAVQGPREYPVSESISSGVMHLAADWKPRGLALYDSESWSQPLVHDSASHEIMAGEYATVDPLPAPKYLNIDHLGNDCRAASCAHRRR